MGPKPRSITGTHRIRTAKHNREVVTSASETSWTVVATQWVVRPGEFVKLVGGSGDDSETKTSSRVGSED